VPASTCAGLATKTALLSDRARRSDHAPGAVIIQRQSQDPREK